MEMVRRQSSPPWPCGIVEAEAGVAEVVPSCSAGVAGALSVGDAEAEAWGSRDILALIEDDVACGGAWRRGPARGLGVTKRCEGVGLTRAFSSALLPRVQ